MCKRCLSSSFLVILSFVWFSPHAALAQEGGHSEADGAAIIGKVRQYADDYINKLPNFICVQTTTHSTAGRKGERWHKKETSTAQLVFTDGAEKRTLKTVNGKELTKARWTGGRNELTTEGEFGILFANVLGPNSSAEIKWVGFQQLRGAEVAVIGYSVAQKDSTLKLSRDYLASAVVPYSGEVFADPASGAVLRITKTISEIPPELETESALTVIDYSKVPIGGTVYLLPSAASAEMLLKAGRLKNEMFFSDYRKFEANSTIIFQP